MNAALVVFVLPRYVQCPVSGSTVPCPARCTRSRTRGEEGLGRGELDLVDVLLLVGEVESVDRGVRALTSAGQLRRLKEQEGRLSQIRGEQKKTWVVAP